MKKSQIIAMLFSATLLILFGACQQPKAEESNKVEDFQLDGPSGKLACVLQTPSFKKGEKVPLVILMHGITAQKNDSLMVKLAAKLHEAGLATIRFDFDGHGASEGNFQDMTVPKEIADADVVYVYAMKLPYVKNISLLGHSQGGVVASILAGELGDDKVKSLVLMAPAAVLKDDALNGTSLGAKFDPNNIPDSIPIFKGLALGKDYIKSAQQ